MAEKIKGLITPDGVFQFPEGMGEAPNDGQYYARRNNAWSPLPDSGIPEAPVDGNAYNRKNGAWVKATPGGGGGGASMANEVETDDGSDVQTKLDDLLGTANLITNQLQPVKVLQGAYVKASINPVGSSGTASTTTNTDRCLAYYAIEGGRKYNISVPKTGNSYGLVYSYATILISDETLTESRSLNGYVDTTITCNGGAKQFEIESACDFNYLVVDFVQSSGNPTVVESYQETVSTGMAVEGKKAYDESRNFKAAYSAAWRENARLNIRPVRILGFGNSWLKNCTEYLGQVFDTLGIKYEIHRLYKGSANIYEYYNDTITKSKIFERSVCRNGVWTNLGNVSVDDVIHDGYWDILTLQQQSGHAGIESSWYPYVSKLIAWVKKTCDIEPMIFIHSTWAYPEGAEHSDFALYDNNTTTMYNAILNAISGVMETTGIYNVIPTTPMIQQGRTLGVPMDLDDGSHLKAGAGYAAGAFVWAEALLRLFFNNDVVDASILDTTITGGMSAANAQAMRNIAKNVVANYKSYYPCFQNQ